MSKQKVSIGSTAIKIISAIAEISQNRKDDKSNFINACSISKLTGLNWHTVDSYLQSNLKIKELQKDE